MTYGKTCIDIIRDVRGDDNWISFKSSVSCSIHFDAYDLYTTKGGFVRVVTYAVPKKYLFKPPNIQEHRPNERNISSAVEESSTVNEAVASSLEHPLSTEQFGYPSTSPPNSSMTPAEASKLEQPSMSEQSGYPSTSLHLLPSPTVNAALATKLEQPLMSEQSGCPSLPLLVSQSSSLTEAALCLEQPLIPL